MSLTSTETAADVPVLARIWQEDDVWNISAFDLPVVAYGEDLKAASSNFNEAIQCHFQALADFHRLEATLQDLKTLAQSRGFWEDRVQPRQMVERFTYRPDPTGLQLCSAL